MYRRTIRNSNIPCVHVLRPIQTQILRPGHRRSGFSFAEVMFAVVILGVGFVMVTAVFPIAVEQTRSTADDAAAAQLAHDCMGTITSATHADDYPDTPDKTPLTRAFADVGSLMNAISGNLICPTNPRYACVPFFAKSPDDGTVRLTVLVVRRWSSDAYHPLDLAGDLTPRGVSIAGITREPDGSDLVEITRDTSDAHADQSIAPGTFLIIRSGDGDVAGRAFRVLQKQSENAASVFWTLDPSAGLLPGETVSSASAAIIGRDYVDPSNQNSGYTGPSQDVAVYTTFLRPQ